MNIRSHSVQRSTPSRVGAAIGVAGAASGISQTAALATEAVAEAAAVYIPTQAVTGPFTSTISKLLYTPGVGLASGVIGGLAIGWAASGDQPKIVQEKGFSWKKLATKPFVDLHNQGVELRDDITTAKRASSRAEAFELGAQAGGAVGKSLGNTAGMLQGGLSGAALGWQVSGAASDALLGVLGETLPKEVAPFVPALVGLTCLAVGQMTGSALGGAIGSGVGWAVGSTVGGSYAALHREH